MEVWDVGYKFEGEHNKAHPTRFGSQLEDFQFFFLLKTV